jgi:hypothetical protein
MNLDKLVTEFSQRRAAGNKVVVRVDNVTQGVALAQELQKAGQCDWFRGQIQPHPTLSPSFNRLSEAGREAARLQISRFVDWLKDTPGVEDLAANIDKAIAVAQHYQMPTTFLDFTSNPLIAGFFAADGSPPPEGEESCIICLNLAEAQRLWADAESIEPGTGPQALEIDVANLWRLESQYGRFVWCPISDLDAIYPLDRIIFPYTGPSVISRDAVYPLKQSPLELLLNQYFQLETIRTGMSNLTSALACSGVGFRRVDAGDEPTEDDFFEASPPDMDSWPDFVSGWVAMPRESIAEIDSRKSLPLTIDRATELRSLAEDLKCQAEMALGNLVQPPKSIRWNIARNETDVSSALFESTLDRLWLGMSRHPYPVEELAAAIGASLSLIIADRQDPEHGRAAARVLGDAIQVEIGGFEENVHSRGWMNGHSLRWALRDDFERYLRPEKRVQVMSDSFELLMASRRLRNSYDFDRLRTVFARELIPSQIVLESHYPTFFSPARAKVIGPP